MTELYLGRFELNTQKQELLYHAADGTTTLRKLSFREASILGLLIEAQGDIVENHILLNEFWEGDSIYHLNSLYVFMSLCLHVAHEAHPCSRFHTQHHQCQRHRLPAGTKHGMSLHNIII